MSIGQPLSDAVPVRVRGLFRGRVEANDLICREHYRLRLRVVGSERNEALPPTRPGQFIQLGCRAPDAAIDADVLLGGDREWEPGQRPNLRQLELCGPAALLRRPFSLAGRGDDAGGAWLQVIHRAVGVGTQWLAKLRVGDAVDMIGPLGNAFELTPGKSLGLLVGGGVGLPPMFYLAEALHAAKWQAVGFVGAMGRDLLAVTLNPQVVADATGSPLRTVGEYSRFGYPAVITTDDGSLGLAGRITAGLSRYLERQTPDAAGQTIIFTCGPEPMMHAVADLAAEYGIECQVCLEQAMACGMGTCQSCVVRIESPTAPHGKTAHGRPWRYRLACTDGPVFNSQQVIW